MDGFKLTHKKKLIVDTDPGIDDAQAITMLINTPDIEVIISIKYYY